MMLEQINAMVDNELEDFEKENQRRKGLKSLVDFSGSDKNYDGKQLDFEIKPKFKQKLNVSVYVKEDKNKRSLF